MQSLLCQFQDEQTSQSCYVTSCSLLETSQTSSVRSPKYLALDISSTNCAFKTLPMKRNISLIEPAERCLKYLPVIIIFKPQLLKDCQKTHELLVWDLLLGDPVHSEQGFKVNFISSILNFSHFFFKRQNSAEKLCCNSSCMLLRICMIFNCFSFEPNSWVEAILLAFVLVI